AAQFALTAARAGHDRGGARDPADADRQEARGSGEAHPHRGQGVRGGLERRPRRAGLDRAVRRVRTHPDLMPLLGLQHTLVLTDDLARTMAFYRDLLGFEVGERPELPFRGYWLYLDGVACLHVAERGPYEAHASRMGLPAKASAIDHVAFEAEEYDELLERLEAADIEVTTNAVPGGVRQLFFDDPNGARVELVVRP